MEELRSTEVLDREILDDARKKAHKILKTADDTLAAQDRDWGKKIEGALDSVRNTYAERTKKTTEEILARFPLDKRRLRSETSEGFLSGAMEDFLRSLERGKLLSVLERELSERIEAVTISAESRDSVSENAVGKTAAGKSAGSNFSGKSSESGEDFRQVELRYSGMALSEVKKLLEKIPSSGGWKLAEAASAGEGSASGEFPCIVIDARSFKITASVENAAAALLKDKRAELARALLGEGVLND